MGVYGAIDVALWGAWFGYWVIASRSTARARSLEPAWSRLVQLAAVVASVALVVSRPLHMGWTGGTVVAPEEILGTSG